MSLKYGSAHVKRMVDALEAEHATVEDAAMAAFAAAEQVFEERAKFTVVGQLSGSAEREHIPPGDPEAIKLALGWYSTEGDARAAAESLFYSAATQDKFRVWTLDVFHGSPAELSAKRKAVLEAAAEKRKEAHTERLRLSIQKRMEAAEIRNQAGKGSCIQCGHMPYDHKTDGSSRGACLLTDCDCVKWSEKKK